MLPSFGRFFKAYMRVESDKVNFFRSIIPLIAFQTFEDEQTLVISKKKCLFFLKHFKASCCISFSNVELYLWCGFDEQDE